MLIHILNCQQYLLVMGAKQTFLNAKFFYSLEFLGHLHKGHGFLATHV